MRKGSANKGPATNYPMLTDVQEALPTERSKLKAIFIQRESEQQENYIKDLEKSLKINKEIIANLVTGDTRMEEATLRKLGEENTFLQTQIKTLKKQRDDYHAKWLISQQIIEEFRNKEKTGLTAHKAEIDELRAELDEKEYAAQFAQQKFNKIASILQKNPCKDKNLCILLMSLHKDLEEGENNKISNVIEENRRLQSELSIAKVRISTLESHTADDNSLEAHKEKAVSMADPSPKKLAEKPYTDLETVTSFNLQLQKKVFELEKANSNLHKQNIYLQTTAHSLSAKDTRKDSGQGSELFADQENCNEPESQGAAKGNSEIDLSFADISSIVAKLE